MSEPNAEVVQQLRQLLGEKGVRVQPDAVHARCGAAAAKYRAGVGHSQDVLGRRAGSGAAGRQDGAGQRAFRRPTVKSACRWSA